MLSSKKNRIALYLSAFVVVALVLFAVLRDNTQSVTLKEALDLLESKKVQKVIATQEYVYLKTNDGVYKIASSQVSPKMFIDYKVEIGDTSNIIAYILFFILFLGIVSWIFRYFQKKEGFEITTRGITKNISTCNTQEMPSQSIEPTESDVTFDDIGGIDDVKMELEEIIDFMKNSKRYKSFGARLPRGVLLVGPPGVGKTMIAKAVANAAGVPFYYQSGASFVQIYVGMGAKRVHDLFSAAKRNAPSIIFIDEIDAVGKKRDGQRNDEREATLNQLLTEMDGFEASSGVIVIAATNKIEVLDSALLRAGRFDRRIFVELPTKREREAILKKYLQKVPHELDIKELANMTVGFNGAALAALVNEAALLALRQNDFQVTLEHFYQVKDKVMFGKKKLKMLNDEQKKYRVTYQAAKVLVATYFDLPFEKLMLSNEHLTPKTDEPLIKTELENRVQMLLAGMVACDMKYDQHSTNVAGDLEEAKETVKTMCERYAMGSKIVPQKDEYATILSALYTDCESILFSKTDALHQIEQVLAERESITKKEVEEILR